LDDRTPEKDVQRLLGEWNFLQNDLVPIFCNFRDQKHIVEAVLELIVPLTWPIEGNLPYIVEMTENLRKYQIVLCQEKVLCAMTLIYF
jgi:hypothetical protein